MVFLVFGEGLAASDNFARQMHRVLDGLSWMLFGTDDERDLALSESRIPFSENKWVQGTISNGSYVRERFWRFYSFIP